MADQRAVSIDVSDVTWLVNCLKNSLSTDQMSKMLTRSYRETGRHIKAILASDLPNYYDTTSTHIRKQVGSPQMQNENTPAAGCVINVSGARQLHGVHNKLYSWSRGKSIKVQIVNGKTSVLPDTVPHQGGNAPFVTTGNGQRTVFTRTTAARYPIARVPGVAVPQMPLNLALTSVQEDIKDYLYKRVQHNYNVIINGIVKT